MNAPLRKAGVVMMILFGLLFVNLNWIQVYKAKSYLTDEEHNQVRVQQQEYERQRGEIIVDGKAVAKSVATKDTLKFLRTYPNGPQYAHVTGYRPVSLAAAGIERMENTVLNGTDDVFAGERLLEMLTGREARGGNVVLTIREQVQKRAYDALRTNNTGTRRGAVVALDPETGAVLAMVSMPSYDPNQLVVHDYDAAQAAFQRLDADPAKPLLNRAIAETFPPGSTFKVVVSAAALQAGLSPSTRITGGDTYRHPDTTHVIRNARGVNCPKNITLADALRVSCNTAFAHLGAQELGGDRVRAMAEAFGFGTTPTFDRDPDNVMGVVPSQLCGATNPNCLNDGPLLAQSCIGQNEVRMTPLQGAMIAAAVAHNSGLQMRPYLVDTVQGSDRSLVDKAEEKVLRRPISPEVAAALREMMNGVVANGTGINAQIPGFEVGGKTGTAETGDDPDHGWFIGYARKDGRPLVAVAVLLQNAGPGGSAEAARIAGQVMRAAIAAKGLK